MRHRYYLEYFFDEAIRGVDKLKFILYHIKNSEIRNGFYNVEKE